MKSISAAFFALLLATACQSRSNASGNTSAARTDTATGSRVSGMAGTGDMAMDSSMSRMMDSTRADIRAMNAMSTDQMKSAVPAHRQLAANMLAQMNSDMRSMNMPADPAWAALVDSVRQDLVRLPDLSGTSLKTFMSQHDARLERLMSMHHDMMTKAPGSK